MSIELIKTSENYNGMKVLSYKKKEDSEYKKIGKYEYDEDKIIKNTLKNTNYCFVEVRSEYYKCMFDLDFKPYYEEKYLKNHMTITNYIIEKITNSLKKISVGSLTMDYILLRKNKGLGVHIIYPFLIINSEIHMKIYNNIMLEIKEENLYNIEIMEKIIDKGVIQSKSIRLPYNVSLGEYYYPIIEESTYTFENKKSKEEHVKTCLINTICNSSNIELKIIIEDDDETEQNIYNDDDTMSNITMETFETLELKYKSKIKEDQKKIEVEINTKNEKEKIFKIANIININYLDNYDDWIKICWSLRSISNEYKQICKEISKKSKKYNEHEFNKIWNEYSKNRITGGTLYHYAKKSNHTKFIEIQNEYQNKKEIEKCTDNSLAKIFVELFGDEFIYNKKKVYWYNGLFWEHDENMAILNKKIANELGNYYKNYGIKILNEINKSNNINKDGDGNYKLYKKICKISLQLENCTTIINVSKAILWYIENKNITWEKNPYLFCFLNKVYDLKKNKFVEPDKYDYMFMNSGYNYEEPTEEELKTMNNLISKIFPHEDERKLYLTILSTGLSSLVVEKIVIANGSGGNGKGFLNENMLEVLGEDYGYIAPNSLLLNPIKVGNCPELANMNYKRLCIYREPDENTSIQASSLKEITGGDKINARLNNSNNTSCNLKATHICECNKKPSISGTIDDSIVRRIIDIYFRSLFVNKNEMKNYNSEYIYEKDLQLKTTNFKMKHRCAFFKILTHHFNLFVNENENIDNFICESIKTRTQSYLETVDEIKNWIDENYTDSDNNDIVQIKDMYNWFKLSDFWDKLSKMEQRKMTYGIFLEKISTNIYLRRKYKEIERRKNIIDKYNDRIDDKKTKIRNVLIGLKKI